MSRIADFEAAFEHWVADRVGPRALRQQSSQAVYRSMWEAFSRWCIGRRIGLADLAPEHIEAFVDERAESAGLSDRHAWRWLMLIDAVLRQRLPLAALAPSAAAEPPDHAHDAPTPGARLARTAAHAPSGREPNRAAAQVLASRPDWQYANASNRDEPPEYLTAPQARHLVRWLLGAGATVAMPGASLGSWQSVRNRCASAMHLGAGLTPGDLRALQVRSVVVAGGRVAGLPWRLRVPAHGAVDAREVPLAAWAGRLLKQWLATREGLAVPGEVLFPGTRKGRAWSKVSHYTAMGTVMKAAGVDGQAGGSYVLRHTFALRQLRRGHDPAEVARWLGVTDPGVMARYQGIAFDPDLPD